MNSAIRVMLCDDSSMMRRMIKSAMALESSMSVVCEVANGREAIEKVAEAAPDVLVMDVEMPVMDGVEAAREIRKRHRTLPIIMFSSLTSRGADASLDAMSAGANDFATKPSGAGHIQKAMEVLRRDLIPKVYQWAGQSKPRNPIVQPGGLPTAGPANPREGMHAARQYGSAGMNSAAPGMDTSQGSSDRLTNRISVVGIGSSTGGPQALAAFFQKLPKNFPLPILVAQHMPPTFTGLMARRLANQTGHNIREAKDGDELRPGSVLVAPGDFHMTVVQQQATFRVNLDQGPPVNSCRPSVDPLFSSMADCFAHQALAIVMTGMGQDGLGGAQVLKRRGASVFVQDQSSSIVWGMPGQIAKQGLADRIFPIDRMAEEVVAMSRNGRSSSNATVSV